ncbi:hypothetical protein NUU61_007651 [Penicillium alfredii]|uniref:Zn(2)-C6 fungal-type domain-containing protein n=1 Tax=Penicillium alfredii TaxID=1506179 RepID=A0A9W9ER26_9EURO|nr:uncharacterized protein NUU61_007651 [Penicillium alfredii]KAJ5086344.1 hypothetical protein NUU61_007651 [Penicillium alfredii]
MARVETGISLSYDVSALGSEPKRHAACDECRKRKLKCSGEPTGCSRCIKQSIICQYSIQKQMGRPPKKRARTDDEEAKFPAPLSEPWPSPDETSPYSLTIHPDQNTVADADHLCPQFFWQPGRVSSSPQSQPVPDLLAGEDDHNHTWRPDRLKNMNLPVFPSSSPWPDFSTVSEATAIPLPMPTSFPTMGTLPLSPEPISSDPATPKCTCLSYLYLCLSHISSLASFPVDSHTVCSLYIAARTIQDVIRCQSCPKVFATGVQNIMFTGTLLTVVADAWLRVYKSNAVELGIQTAPADYVTRVMQSADPTQGWEDWLRQIVRRAVIGGPAECAALGHCSDQPDLLSLIAEIENRQRRWHEPGQHPLWPTKGDNCTTNSAGAHEQRGSLDEKEHLCVRIVGSSRDIIAKFDFEPQDYPHGAFPNCMQSYI